MAWQDEMQPASFRGVPFLVKSHTKTAGLQGAHHVYPERDEGHVEHMGQKDGKFTVSALVIGDDYMQGRDALEIALTTPGPGKLVHPWHGSMDVSVNPDSDYQLTETVGGGGKAEFTLYFIRAASTPAPRIRNNTGRILGSKIQQSKNINRAQFTDTVKISNIPGFVLDGMENDATIVLETITETADGKGLPTNTNATDLKDASINAETLAATVQAVLNFSGEKLDIVNVLQQVPDLVEKALPVIPNATGLYATVSRGVQAANRSAFVQFLKSENALALAEAVGAAKFNNYSEAMTALNNATTQLDQVMATASAIPGDESYAALGNVRSALVKHIKASSGSLARIVTIVEPMTIPATRLAYELYNDLNRIEDITKRNNIINPNKVPGGKKLEVLSV